MIILIIKNNETENDFGIKMMILSLKMKIILIYFFIFIYKIFVILNLK